MKRKALTFLLIGLMAISVFTGVTSAQDSPVISDENPADGSTVDTTDVFLEVQVAQNNGHDINVTFYEGSDDTGTEIYNEMAQNTASGVYVNTTYTHDLNDDETFTWHVKAVDQSNGYTSEDTYTFTYQAQNTAPDSPTNPSPSDDATGVSVDTTLSIDVDDPNGDLMDVTFYDASDSSKIGSKTDQSNGTVSVTWAGLQYETNHYWYVEVSDGLETTTSSTYSFETTSNGAPTVSNPEPSDGATNVNLSPDLTVDVSDPEGDTMNVSFYDHSDDSLIDEVTGVSNGTYSVEWTDLQETTEYEWYVEVEDQYGYNQSAVWNFTTVLINSAPDIIDNEPSDNADDVDIDKNIQVTVDDPDNDHMTIQFYYGNNQTLINKLIDCSDGTFSVSIPMEYDTEYSWYVEVSDGHVTESSATWNFTTESEPTTSGASTTTDDSFTVEDFADFVGISVSTLQTIGAVIVILIFVSIIVYVRS